MSDNFDREAERERLREKYERDKQKREATEKMSELLLQGATMTNRHCPECHSPVFRYDGSEFCPTCEREVAREETEETADVGEAETAEDAEAVETETEGATETGGEEATEAIDEELVERADETIEAADAELEPGSADAEAADVGAVDETAAEPRTERRRRAEERTDGRRRAGASTDETLPAPSQESRDRPEDDLAEVEASLVRTLSDLARRAEETRDVGRKRQLLAAAREAAETLEALRRV